MAKPSVTHQDVHLQYPGYRPDIDGLRAVAVLSVVFFHAYPGKLTGGFIGVDVFFVISGFLITSILLGGLSQHRFSVLDFYDRRVRRIFPTLLLVLTACAVAGWHLLLADEYKQLGKHIASGAGFISNIVLWQESGYFETAAETKPLLHLWSLGIEEQFYIVWPLLLCLGWKLRLNVLWLIIVLMALSFGLNWFGVSRDATATFYAPYTRAWELLIGAALAYCTLFKPALLAGLGPVRRNMLSLSGALLMLAGFVLIHRERAFPGVWALLPTLGTAMLIAAGPQAWLNRVWLSRRIVVWFGLISFPLYLWHWPALVFLNMQESAPSHLHKGLTIACCVLLAWLSYRWLERPMRQGRASHARALALAGLMLAVGGGGYIVYKRDGMDGWGYREPGKSDYSRHFTNQLPEWAYFERTGMLEKYRDECNFYDMKNLREGKAAVLPRSRIDSSCHTRNPSQPHAVLIWGDSHAQQLYSGLRQTLPSSWQILQIASAGCVPVQVAKDSAQNYCTHSNWVAWQTVLNARPEVVILGQNIGHQPAQLMQLAGALRAQGVKKVIITGPGPHWRAALPTLIMRKLWAHTPERTWEGVDTQVMADNRRLQSQLGNGRDILFADITRVFCNTQGCLTRIGPDRKTDITSWDYGHLTPVASDYLARQLLAELVTRPVPRTDRVLAVTP